MKRGPTTAALVLALLLGNASAHKNWWKGYQDDARHYQKKASDKLKQKYDEFSQGWSLNDGWQGWDGFHFGHGGECTERCKDEHRKAEHKVKTMMEKQVRELDTCRHKLRASESEGSECRVEKSQLVKKLSRANSESARTQEDLTADIKKERHGRLLAEARLKASLETSEKLKEEAARGESCTAKQGSFRELKEELHDKSRETAQLWSKWRLAEAHIKGLEEELTATPNGGLCKFWKVFVCAVVMMFGWLFSSLSALKAQLGESNTECSQQHSKVLEMQVELEAEFGDMIKVDGQVADLNTDFPFHISEEHVDGEIVRFVKVQCPGVEHVDVSIDVIFNGCVLHIARRASRGVKATTWSKLLQFRPSEGLFEFKEDQVSLEHGILQLVFRSYVHQSRVFRFPQHFDLSDGDREMQWMMSSDRLEDDALEAEVHNPKQQHRDEDEHEDEVEEDEADEDWDDERRADTTEDMKIENDHEVEIEARQQTRDEQDEEDIVTDGASSCGRSEATSDDFEKVQLDE
eukprot:CAMPEP_0177206358 /NCGR_PEP_ID=MMETSP0367-20130122/29349_1 /TAXON_ID=447022 ORGANISM="Scrippsiella hangoei-like, Strain SHHI-4" /NCGR_SAMPLE_ID=MMETSP0367 /ASSEMBLY_ACC=CAM_ASM_000362 /LENGTH=519 /DNA_ID=CAMNT_0018655137 /DNA_START=134 /DNA_END=1693 /DNA_ORIENTATION=-